MRTGFIDKIKSVDGGTIKVIKRPGPTTGPITMTDVAMGVGHTIEGSNVPSSWPNGCPNTASGPLRLGGRPKLVQMIGFGQYATALRNETGGTETNRLVRIQHEIAGYSSLEPWLPASKQHQVILASLFEWCQQELGIPEHRPFADTLPGGTVWAALGNPRRTSGKFGDVAGWYCHNEIPENLHWDWGSMQARVLLRQAPEPERHVRYAIRAVWMPKDGHRVGEDIIRPTTLKHLGERMATSKAVRSEIRSHRADGHRIVIARRQIVEGGN